MLGGDIESVETIGIDALIAGLQQDRLPGGMGFNLRHRQSGLDDDDPGPVGGPGVAAQNRVLKPLDIDLEKVHGLACRDMTPPDVRQRRDLDRLTIQAPALLPVLFGNGIVQGGQPRTAEKIHRQRRVPITDRQTQIDVPGATFAQLPVEFRIRFDVDAPPTALIESPGHGIHIGRPGADIDVKAPAQRPEGAPEHDIFKILRVGHKTHDRLILISGSIQAQPAKGGLWRLTTLNTSARSRHS